MSDARHVCFHEEDFNRLEKLVTKVFERMDSFLEEIHAIVIADTERQGKMNQLERDLDRAFSDLRSVTYDVKVMSEWRQRFEGGVKILLAVPVGCTVITTCIALYKMLVP